MSWEEGGTGAELFPFSPNSTARKALHNEFIHAHKHTRPCHVSAPPHHQHQLQCCTSHQDEEVERIERSGRPGGYLGLSRQEVMEGMYGRMETSPAGACSVVFGCCVVCGSWRKGAGRGARAGALTETNRSLAVLVVHITCGDACLGMLHDCNTCKGSQE